MPVLIAKEFQHYYTNRGVPTSTLYTNAPDSLEDHIVRIKYEVKGEAKIVTVDRQLEYLKSMSDVSKPYIALVSGKTDDSIAAQIALLVCAHTLEKNVENKFYWHTLTGAFKDKIRDDDVLEAEVRSSHLLIISNVAKNSTNIKLEKLRDILELHSHIPRIVVVGGIDPIEFAQTVLYIKPTYMIYSGK